MEQVKRRRGRPKKVVEESPVNVEAKADTLSVDETSAQAKYRQSQEVKKAQESLNWTGKKYYVLQPHLRHNGRPDNKVILVREKNNGAKYRTFVCWESKQKDFVSDLKSKGLVVNG